jgi:hypothetical protein
MRVRLLGVGAALAVACGAYASEQPDLSQWRIEHGRKTVEVGASTIVRIVNLWGGVNLRAGDGNEIVITTAGQRHKDDPREPEIRVGTTPSGVAIELGFNDEHDVEERLDWRDRRIDVGVAVPDALEVAIRVDDDDIEVRDLAGFADLESTSGDISFKGPAGLRARSGSGSVFAQFRRSDWSRPAEVTTRTGAIRVEFLEGASVNAVVETRGPITTDFTVEIERERGSRLKRGTAVIGDGGQTVRLTSDSGAVRLVAVIVPEGGQGD